MEAREVLLEILGGAGARGGTPRRQDIEEAGIGEKKPSEKVVVSRERQKREQPPGVGRPCFARHSEERGDSGPGLREPIDLGENAGGLLLRKEFVQCLLDFGLPHASGGPTSQMSKYRANSYGCGRRRIGLTSRSRL